MGRVDDNGIAYTRADFIRYYGKDDGQWYWDCCSDVAIRPAIAECNQKEFHSPSDLVVPVKFGEETDYVWVSLAKVLEVGAGLILPSLSVGKVTSSRMAPHQPPLAKSEFLRKKRPAQLKAGVAGNHSRLGRRKM